HQDVRLYSGLLERDQEVVYELHEERHAWVQVARGSLTLNGQPLWQGDGAAVRAAAAARLIGAEATAGLGFDPSSAPRSARRQDRLRRARVWPERAPRPFAAAAEGVLGEDTRAARQGQRAADDADAPCLDGREYRLDARCGVDHRERRS